MAQIIITINHREYAISCENGEEGHILKLANYLDEKASALTQALGPINENQLLAMIGLLVADELSESQKANTKTQSLQDSEPTPQTTVADTAPQIDKEALAKLDETLAEEINSLNETIKSVALNILSI